MAHSFCILTFLLLLGTSFVAEASVGNDSIRAIIKYMDSVRSIYYDNELTERIIKEHGWDSEEMKAHSNQKQRLDSIQLVVIMEMIDNSGYPGRSTVGEEYQNVALLILKNNDNSILKKYLPIIQEAADSGEIELAIVARYIDRIRLQDRQKQLYGTHLKRNKTTNKWEIQPIEDEACVDVRRAAMGLEPLKEYVKPMGIKYKRKGKCKTQAAQQRE